MNIKIGYSPCPNDTFIFDAMVHQKIDTEGLIFEPVLADVEELNRMAFAGELDATKLSFHALLYTQNHYRLLESGSALGNNCGPLLIAKKQLDPHSLSPEKIAIPGVYTTANFLLQYYLKKHFRATPVIFSDIEDLVLKDRYDAGVIIHESRFTFEAKGLLKIQDLGEYWESQTGLPIPLGAIVCHKRLGNELHLKFDRVLKKSVQFALDHPMSSRDYVKKHSQELADSVIQSHIDLYVNRFTLDLGAKGHAAIERLYKEASALNLATALDK